MLSFSYRSLIEKLIYLTVFLFPVEQILTAIGYVSLGRFSILTGLLVIIFTVLERLNISRTSPTLKRRIVLSHCLFFAFFFIATSSYFWSSNPMQTLISIYQVLFLFMLSVFLEINARNIDLSKIRAYIVLSTLISCCILYFNSPQFFSEADAMSKRIYFESVSINAVASIWSLGFIVAFYSIAIEKSLIKKVFYFIALLFLLFFLLRSGTRSVFLGVPLSLILSALIVYRHKLIVFLPQILTISSLMVLLVFIFFTFIDTRIVERLLFDGSDIGENSRWELWEAGLLWYSQNWLGSGLGSEAVAMAGLQTESHNTFISVLIQTSLIGGICFTLWYLSVGYISFINTKTDPKWQLIVSSLFIFITIQAMKGTLHTSRMFWFFIIVVLLSQASVYYRGSSTIRMS